MGGYLDATMEGPFYIVRGGRREGPLTWTQVGALYGTGEVAEASLIWTKEMEKWGRLGDLLPKTPPAWEAPAKAPEGGGIKRGAYCGWQAGMLLVFGLIAFVCSHASANVLLWHAAALYIIGANLAVVMRLQNIGYNPWLVLLIWVPFAGFHHAAACVYAPEGYARTKELDSPGRVLFWLSMAAIFAVVTMFLMACFDSFF